MSFPKAKLKRFNDVTDASSPFCDKKEAKKAEKIKENSSRFHDFFSSKQSVNSDTDSKHSSKLRLFRTPSLPKRLRFRQNTELSTKNITSQLTPTKQSNPIKDKEALDEALVEIRNKTETLKEYEVLIEELKGNIHELNETVSNLNLEKIDLQTLKDTEINQLEREIESVTKADELLSKIAEKSLEKINEMDEETKAMMKIHDNQLNYMSSMICEMEIKYEGLLRQTKKLSDTNVYLQNEADELSGEIKILKISLEDQSTNRDLKLKNLMDENSRLLDGIQKLQQQSNDDMIAYVEEGKNMIKQLDSLRKETYDLDQNIREKDELLKQLEEELSSKDIEMDTARDELRESYEKDMQQLCRKYEQQIANLNEVHDMRIKEIDSIFVLEKSQTMKMHSEKFAELELERISELERINERAEEKIKISEIQIEEKIKALEVSLVNSIKLEKSMWKLELDKCQKIAETEIIQCEYEKRDLKELLNVANELVREKDNKIDELEMKLINEKSCTKEDLESDLMEAKRECARIMTEKYNYQITLNNTRSTLNILMERLKKSDTDVEIMKADLEAINVAKLEIENNNGNLIEEVQQLRCEIDEYRIALGALKQSSQILELEMKEKDNVFEKLVTSEEETLQTIDKIGQLFNEKIEENISKYFEMYTELKKKYEAREAYIKDMKSLLDEFATGIELARMELDIKDSKLFELQKENKTMKLENMTSKFKCEHFEKYYDDSNRVPNSSPDLSNEDIKYDENGMVSNILIENIIIQLEKEASETKDFPIIDANEEIYSENHILKEKLLENEKQIEFLQEIIELENDHATENLELKKQVKILEEKQQQVTEKRDNNFQKKNKIVEELEKEIVNLRLVKKDQENKISELREQISYNTPRKIIPGKITGTPKTPKTPLIFGKENMSPAAGLIVVSSPKTNILKNRNN